MRACTAPGPPQRPTTLVAIDLARNSLPLTQTPELHRTQTGSPCTAEQLSPEREYWAAHRRTRKSTARRMGRSVQAYEEPACSKVLASQLYLVRAARAHGLTPRGAVRAAAKLPPSIDPSRIPPPPSRAVIPSALLSPGERTANAERVVHALFLNPTVCSSTIASRPRKGAWSSAACARCTYRIHAPAITGSGAARRPRMHPCADTDARLRGR